MSGRVTIVDRGYKAAMNRIRAMAGSVEVGVFSGYRAPGSKLTLSEIAAVNEYGSADGRVPSRPFLRLTMNRVTPALQRLTASLVGKVIDGRETKEAMLNEIGSHLKQEVQRTIDMRVPPPNAPSTIAKKGSDHPLIDTGRLRSAISWRIKAKGEKRAKGGE